MAPDSDDPDDAAALRERVRQLEATVSDQQDTIERMLPSRRQAIAGGALLGGGLLGGAGASRRASAQSAAGQVGTSSEPVDVSAFDLDVAGEVTSNVDLAGNDLSARAIDANTVNADEGSIRNITLRQSDISDISQYDDDEVTISADTYHTIFDVSGSVDVVDGLIQGDNTIQELRITWGDGSTNQTASTIARTLDANGDRISWQIIPPIKNAAKLEFLSHPTVEATYGWEVFTI